MMKSSLYQKIAMILLVAVLLTLGMTVAVAEAADPTGASYVATTGSETLNDVATKANQAYFGANYTWVMLCAFLVFFFQCQRPACNHHRMCIRCHRIVCL